LHVRPVPHAWQLAPPLPHVPSLDVWHWPFASQQPLGHVVPSHTHLPCVEHLWLAPQAAHCTPPTPHVALDDVWQVPFEQQPVQDVLPQLHAPLLHVCPAVHDPHALPAEPHVAVDWDASGMHLLVLSQQPPVQEAGVQVQTPMEHACPVAQAPHAAPALPHLAFAWLANGTHVVPSQQPLGQVTASHLGTATSIPPSVGGVTTSMASPRETSLVVASPVEASRLDPFPAEPPIEASALASGAPPPRPPVVAPPCAPVPAAPP
jgi:hypothetical protein